MKQKAVELIKGYTHHDFVQFTSRGNSAIFAALYCARTLNPQKYILVPDQGGWLTYHKYPKQLELETKEVKTDNGIIDLNDLAMKLDDACALIYCTPAGYIAEQPIKEIYELCKKNNCMVILDVSGALGSDMCDGRYADFMVGSFGKWKPVDLGYGGFVTAAQKDYFEKPKSIFDTSSFEEQYFPVLVSKLEHVKERFDALFAEVQKIKDELKDFDLIHRDKRGLVVVAKYRNNDEKQQLIEYCLRHHYEYTQCPRYIRVNCEALSIEMKRL
jgi:histidinol-phosphate/aromatic aminotransferase/cobyric acid decarboxylase-like protein